MNQPNNDLRLAAAGRGVPLWKIAEALGITDSSFSRKLRHELSPEEKQKIYIIIERIAEERSNG
ncbi:MAG: hypothetical protein IKW92_06565 [Firmicutes bacterium]|nr:hypothetical protein [Bacillota bacterium]